MAESMFRAVVHILKIVIYSWKCYTRYTNNGWDEPTFLAEKVRELFSDHRFAQNYTEVTRVSKHSSKCRMCNPRSVT